MANDLLTEIHSFLTETGMSAYRFGFLAARNGRLVERLEAGRRIWPETEEMARDFMRSERQRRAAALREAS